MRITFLQRTALAAGLTAWTAAAGLLALVLTAGAQEAPGLVLDRLTSVLVVLIVGVSAVIAVFSTRYLQDDPRLGRFLALLALTTAGSAVFAAAATVTVLLAGWLVAGAGFLALMAHRRDLPGTRRAARRMRAAFAVGDLALAGAVGIVLAAAGDAPLGRAAALDPGAAGVAAVLIVVAALARCAQVPLHGWLPGTVAAPTPVSALLHAGVVNAGGILLVRMGPVTGLPPAASGLLLAAGTATAVMAAGAMLARPDVKGALAHSTAAQMGFMLVQVALGAAGAAVVHLIGHAMYKATLFLGSGSAVAAWRRGEAAPARTPVTAPVRAAAALGLPLAALAGAVALAGGPAAVGGAAALPLLAFAWSSGAHAVDGWLRSGPPRGLALAAAGTAGAAGAYVALVAGAKALLAPALGDLPAAPAWLSAPLVALVLATTALAVLPRPAALARRVERLRDRLYVWVLEWGDGGPALPRAARARRAPALVGGEPFEVAR